MRNKSSWIIILVVFLVFNNVTIGFTAQGTTPVPRDQIRQLLTKAIGLRSRTEGTETYREASVAYASLVNLGKGNNQVIDYYRDILLGRSEIVEDIKGRVMMILILDDLGDEELISILSRLLEDTNPGMRGVAITKLAYLHTTTAIPKIRKLATEDPNEKVRNVALEALLKLESVPVGQESASD